MSNIFNNYEPSRKNRFVVIFPDRFEIQSFLVQKINKPKLLGGVWQDFHLEFIETPQESISLRLFDLINYCNVNRSNPLFTMILINLDPDGGENERWTISVSEIVNVDFGDYDYGNDDYQVVKLVLRPSNCILNNSTVFEWEKHFKKIVLFEKYSSKKID